MLNISSIRDRGLHLSVLWDIFMTLMAAINLSFILFDLTYLWLRPYYYHLLPNAVAIYDPVKGIEKHRETNKYLEKVQQIERIYQKEGKVNVEMIQLANELKQLSVLMIDTDPFKLSGQSAYLHEIKHRMRDYMHKQEGYHFDSFKNAFNSFWSLNDKKIVQRLDFFHKEIKPRLEVNFYRHRSVTGAFVDNFWRFDLPFLILFAIEFLVRWILAIKRKTYLRWFVFPLYNWYDVLGLIPAKEFRIFRLFRLVSIYVRLRRSNVTNIGNDIVTRTVKKYSNILTEEISDLVALRILSEVQDEVRHGSSMGVVSQAIGPKKEEIKEMLLDKVEIVTKTRLMPLKPSIKELTRISLEKSVTNRNSPLYNVPLPESVMRPISMAIGEQIVEILFSTIEATVESEDGKKAIGEVINEAIDITIHEMGSKSMDILVQDILISSIDNIKHKVSVKKWADSENDFRIQK